MILKVKGYIYYNIKKLVKICKKEVLLFHSILKKKKMEE